MCAVKDGGVAANTSMEERRIILEKDFRVIFILITGQLSEPEKERRHC